MTNPFTHAEHDTPAPLQSGLALTLATAVLMVVVSFLDLPHVLVVTMLAVGTAGAAGGLVAHVLLRRAHVRRDARLREWAETSELADLDELRADLAERDRAVEELDTAWGMPLWVSFALVVSAGVVPWEMISPLAPSPDVDLLTTWWLAVSLLTAGACAVLSVVAGVRSEGHETSTRQREDA